MKLLAVFAQLNTMAEQIGNGKNFSRDQIQETFTDMLQSLIKK